MTEPNINIFLFSFIGTGVFSLWIEAHNIVSEIRDLRKSIDKLTETIKRGRT